MKRSCLVVVAVALALAAAASAGARIPEPAPLQPLPLALRVLQPAALPGNWVVVHLQGFASARPGAVAGLREQLDSGSDRVVSVVVQCSSSRAARAQLSVWHGRTPGMTVSFVDGDFAYFVSVTRRLGTELHLTRTQLAAAVTTLYERVHGRPAAG